MTREKELKKELEAIERAKYDAIYHEEAPKMRMKFERKYFGFTYFNKNEYYKFVYIDWIDLTSARISLTDKSLAFDCHGWSFGEKATNGELTFKIIPKGVFSSMDMNCAVSITKKEFYEAYNKILKTLNDLK